MTDHSVLVLTRLDDPTADIVITGLLARGVPVVRLDPGDFMTGQAWLSATYGQDGTVGAVTTSTRELNLAHVRSVYFRRPSPYIAPEGMAEQDRVFAIEQARHGFSGVLASLDCRFVNHPWDVMRADQKPAALRVAAETGFNVPPTIVTNRLHDAGPPPTAAVPWSTNR